MIAIMPRPRKTEQSKTGYVDVFSRMSAESVRKLDALADDQHRSRSGMVAWIVEQFIAREYPQLSGKRSDK